MPTSSPALLTRVHGRIGLDEGLDLELTGVVRHAAALGAHDTGCDGAAQLLSKRRSDCKHPFAQAEFVGVRDGNDGQTFGFDLDEGHIRSGIRSDHLRFVGLVIVQSDLDLGGALHDMVVRDYIAVLAYDYAGAAPLLLAFLRLRHLVAEEELEEGVYVVLLGALDGNFYEHHRVYCRFRGIGEIGVIVLCQIDSAVLHCIPLRIFYNSGLGGLRSGYFHYAIGGKTACQY